MYWKLNLDELFEGAFPVKAGFPPLWWEKKSSSEILSHSDFSNYLLSTGEEAQTEQDIKPLFHKQCILQDWQAFKYFNI